METGRQRGLGDAQGEMSMAATVGERTQEMVTEPRGLRLWHSHPTGPSAGGTEMLLDQGLWRPHSLHRGTQA